MAGISDASHRQLARCSNYRVPELSAEEYAKEAIESYRIDHGLQNPSHEFVNALSCHRFLAYYPGQRESFAVREFCHVSFKARASDSSDDVLIFAQLIDCGLMEFDVSRWSVLNPDGPPGITFQCGFCPPEINCPHPAGGDYVGAGCDYTPPDEATEQELAKNFKSLVESNKNRKKPLRGQIYFDTTLPDESNFTPKLSHAEYAELAISYINIAEGAEFELVEALGSSRQLLWIKDYRHWCHVFFIAKYKNGDAKASPVRFFAELYDPGQKRFKLSTYSRVEHGTKKGCGFCPDEENYIHPAQGSYIAGDFSSIDLDEL